MAGISTFSTNPDVELDAVNDILSAIGETAVTTAEGADDNADVANALRCLRNANESIQSKGWSFNITDDVSFTPEFFSKQIPFLSTYLSVTASGGGGTYRNRGGFIYDTSTRTDLFEAPITVRLIELQNFEDMPECFRRWIVIKASRTFNNRFFGAPEIEANLSEEEADARRDCMAYEMDYGNFNMLTSDVWTSGRTGRV